MDNKKAVVLLSGGVDSTTAAYLAKEAGYELHALSLVYGQRGHGKGREDQGTVRLNR